MPRPCILGTLLAAGFLLSSLDVDAVELSDSDLDAMRVCGHGLVVDRDTTLKQGCRYTGSTTVVGSGVTLDCNGAILDAERKARFPLLIGGKSNATDIDIENCTAIRGRSSGIFVGLTAPDSQKPKNEFGQVDYDAHPHDITISRSQSTRNISGGLYVDDHVQEVTLVDSSIEANGRAGVYLEHDSRGSRIVNNRIEGNGFGKFPGWSDSRRTSREGVAIDSSENNEISGNTIKGNSAGGIFLYRNCGEQPDNARQVARTMPTRNNLIENNTVSGGRVGIWVASRQEREVTPDKCRLEVDPSQGVFADDAPNNVVRGNTVTDVTYGIRVGDDGNQIIDNDVTANDQCMVLGSESRTALGHPVRGLVVRDNDCNDRRTIQRRGTQVAK